MKALIMTADGFEDSELIVPLNRLKEAGLHVDVAAPKAGQISGKHGISVKANKAISDVSDLDQYDLLFLPGGKGPESVRLEKKALEICRAFMDQHKPVAAICHGPQVLISAGLVKGHKMTCWKGVMDDLKAAGADVQDQEVVVDDNLVTSRQPDDLPAFCREMMKKLQH